MSRLTVSVVLLTLTLIASNVADVAFKKVDCQTQAEHWDACWEMKVDAFTLFIIFSKKNIETYDCSVTGIRVTACRGLGNLEDEKAVSKVYFTSKHILAEYGINGAYVGPMKRPLKVVYANIPGEVPRERALSGRAIPAPVDGPIIVVIKIFLDSLALMQYNDSSITGHVEAVAIKFLEDGISPYNFAISVDPQINETSLNYSVTDREYGVLLQQSRFYSGNVTNTRLYFTSQEGADDSVLHSRSICSGYSANMAIVNLPADSNDVASVETNILFTLAQMFGIVSDLDDSDQPIQDDNGTDCEGYMNLNSTNMEWSLCSKKSLEKFFGDENPQHCPVLLNTVNCTGGGTSDLVWCPVLLAVASACTRDWVMELCPTFCEESCVNFQHAVNLPDTCEPVQCGGVTARKRELEARQQCDCPKVDCMPTFCNTTLKSEFCYDDPQLEDCCKVSCSSLTLSATATGTGTGTGTTGTPSISSDGPVDDLLCEQEKAYYDVDEICAFHGNEVCPVTCPL